MPNRRQLPSRAEPWEDEKNSVVRLRITTDEGIGLCTGAMVNNTSRDCRQLMLSGFTASMTLTQTIGTCLKSSTTTSILSVGESLPSTRERVPG